MRYTDVAIVGGGLAGSTAAAMLGRAGVATVLIDPHAVYPQDFRCEKLGGNQISLLEKTGFADAVLAATTLDSEVWEVRFGRVVARKPSDQHGILYPTLVNTVRAQIPAGVERLIEKAAAIQTSADRQRITLTDGDSISARLVVLSNGLNIGLRDALGIRRTIISPCHSITIGFDIAPVGQPRFDFPALTYWTSRARDRLAYLTLFPIGDSMRANLMVYRDIDDPWLRAIRKTPEDAIAALMPNLVRLIGGFQVEGPVRVRPADLYVTDGHRQDGIVLIGDAFATSCPAAGTGTNKVFTDVTQLCDVHIPRWLATEGMGVDKIAAFYDDPVKSECDTWSQDKAHYLKALSIQPGPTWQARRLVRFGVRLMQGALSTLSGEPDSRGHKAVEAARLDRAA